MKSGNHPDTLHLLLIAMAGMAALLAGLFTVISQQNAEGVTLRKAISRGVVAAGGTFATLVGVLQFLG